jgi:zinc transport system substrate-binding protein
LIVSARSLCAGLVAVAVLGACGGGGEASGASDDRAKVVASFYPLAEAARQVGGDHVDVQNLTPPGAEPHDLELTTKQVDALEDAEVVVVLGGDFQPAIEDVADRRDGETVRALDAVSIDPARRDDDPHIWLDPQLMREIVDAVATALGKADPAHAPSYAANAERYDAELARLDAEIKQDLQHCRRKEIFTAHAAFGWFAKRYGLEQHAIAGRAPDEEPSPDRIAELSDRARAEGATTIFIEPLVSPDLAKTVAREAGGLHVETLDPLEGLTEHASGAGADYVSVMRDNAQSLRDALDCT